MKKLFITFSILCFASTSLFADLPETFTAAKSDLVIFKAIKDQTKSPDECSDSLVTFAQEISQKMSTTIPADDERRQAFDQISSYLQEEIELEKLTLNRLNYIVFQMAIAMNPTVSTNHDIFQGVDLIIENDIWMLPYDDAFATVQGYVAQQKAAGHLKADDEEELHQFIITIFRPCDRGLWVFPLVNDNPIYGIKTYSDAFVEGITMTGLPLKAENCNVHQGLIKAGDFVYFLVHDLLHVQTLASSRDPQKNEVHIKAMRRVTGKLMDYIAKKDVAGQMKGYTTLFLLNHELVNNIDLSQGGVIFNGTESLQDVFAGMIKHSHAYLDYTINPALANRDSYYHHFLTKASLEEVDHPLKNRNFVVEEVINNEGDLTSYTFYGKPIDNIAKSVCILVRLEDTGGLILEQENAFYSHPTQLQFVYAQVELMKYMGDLGDGTNTFGATLATFNPVKANSMLSSVLDGFEEDYKAAMA